jgi:glucose-6-phosphate 1-dehydrogenase
MEISPTIFNHFCDFGGAGDLTWRKLLLEMRFSYNESFPIHSPDAYETLLWDVMNNDPTLFMRADQVEAAWQLLMPVLQVWAEASPRDFPNYAAGTRGPPADKLLARDGHSWRLIA